jgi:hypothetical protein
MTRAMRAAASMQIIEGLTDAEIAEAHRSAEVFAEIQDIRERSATERSYIEANSPAAKRTRAKVNAIWNHWLQLQSPTVDDSRSAILCEGFDRS